MLRRKLERLRWLDPACGSGTFLVLLIKRYRELGDRLMVPEEELLEAILKNIVGFDINPLAVITARVNYLLALGDLLEYRKGPITIPVYLADSVLLPELGEDLETSGIYQVRTSVGVFGVPQAVFVEGRFDRFCSLLEEAVRSEVSPDAFLERVVEKLGLSEAERKAAAGPLRALYGQLLELHRKGLDGLWARLLANNFAPLTVGQFDYVVGNPPWVNWEHLPDGYRQAIAPIWLKYELFEQKGMRAAFTKDDVSVLMTYVACDRFLRVGGRLGFLITQSVFKTELGGKGFRRFRLPRDKGKDVPLKVVHVDDMVALNPFEGASNRTAVMVLEKGSPNRYPVPYTVWRKKGRGRFTYDSTLEEVKAATHTLDFFAEPVDPSDPTSPWLTATKPALRAVRKVLGKSDYTAHAGVYTGGANAVYWVEIVAKRPDGLVVVRNITKGAKRKVPEVTEAIEPDLLYPLLRGRDVQRWHAEPSALILMVQDPETRRGIDEEKLRRDYPQTWKYLKRFEPILRERAAFKRYFTRKDKIGKVIETGPFYSMFDVGDYTFAPWKVVWPNIASSLESAVVGHKENKVIVPQHIVTLVAAEDENEVHFICAAVNSTLANFAACAYAQEGGKSFGTPHILEHIRIPKYDPADPVHRALAEASKEAHEAAAQGDEARLREIEDKVDALAAKLWGLTDKELAEIRRCLKELN